MSSNRKKNININDLLQNLKDLENISQQLSTEIEIRNKILVGGINDCKLCNKYIDNNRKINRYK